MCLCLVLPSRTSRYVCRAIALDHVSAKQVESINTDNNLWPPKCICALIGSIQGKIPYEFAARPFSCWHLERTVNVALPSKSALIVLMYNKEHQEQLADATKYSLISWYFNSWLLGHPYLVTFGLCLCSLFCDLHQALELYSPPLSIPLHSLITPLLPMYMSWLPAPSLAIWVRPSSIPSSSCQSGPCTIWNLQ